MKILLGIFSLLICLAELIPGQDLYPQRAWLTCLRYFFEFFGVFGFDFVLILILGGYRFHWKSLRSYAFLIALTPLTYLFFVGAGLFFVLFQKKGFFVYLLPGGVLALLGIYYLGYLRFRILNGFRSRSIVNKGAPFFMGLLMVSLLVLFGFMGRDLGQEKVPALVGSISTLFHTFLLTSVTYFLGEWFRSRPKSTS